jgi:hypothetical protein
MTSSIFLSYCRREAPFADSLLDALEDDQFKVWMDYHSLVPGRPWDEQINKGIAEAEIMLVVTSKESLQSKYVKAEWLKALELKKRIILVLFETVDLPPELEVYEWVDFRSSFKKGLKALKERLSQAAPVKPVTSPPQKGFKAPPLVWLSFILSLGSALLSLPVLWTLYIPYHLIPLPYRILKRDFNIFHVQASLVMLPFALLFLAFSYAESAQMDYLLTLIGIALLLAPILIFLLRSAGMQRWGKPIASLPRFANLYTPQIENPQPVKFVIEYAPQDKKYAETIISTLKRYGHTQVEASPEAEVAFVLISAFKNSTVYDPEKSVVYPILLQSSDRIDPKLQRIQWIDFRRGLKRVEVLAQLLPEPVRLLKALGISPLGLQQTVLPPIIQILVYFLTVSAIFTVGSWFFFLIQLIFDLSVVVLLTSGLLLGVFVGTMLLTMRALITRQSRLVSLRNFTLSMLLLGLLALGLTLVVVLNQPEAMDDLRGLTTLMVHLTYFIGLVIVLPFIIGYWQSLRRWFPDKAEVEEAVLQPAQGAAG